MWFLAFVPVNHTPKDSIGDAKNDIGLPSGKLAYNYYGKSPLK